MAEGPETRLVEKMREAVKAEWPSAFFVKTHGDPFQAGGLPDIFIIIRGHAFGFEVKARKKGERVETLLNRVTPRQRLRLRQIERAGGTAMAVWEVEQVMATIRATLSSMAVAG